MFIRRAAGAGSGVEGACALADCSVICWRPRHWASRADDRPSRVTEGGLGDEAVSGMHGFKVGGRGTESWAGEGGAPGRRGQAQGRPACSAGCSNTDARRSCLLTGCAGGSGRGRSGRRDVTCDRCNGGGRSRGRRGVQRAAVTEGSLSGRSVCDGAVELSHDVTVRGSNCRTACSRGWG